MPHFVLDARTATPHFPGIGRYVSSLAQAITPLMEPGERLTILHHPAHPAVGPRPDQPILPARPARCTRARVAHGTGDGTGETGATVEALPCAVSPFSLSQQIILPRLLRRLGADLYHSAYILMPYAPGVPTLLTVYDLIPLLFPQQSTVRARLLIRWSTRLALRAAKEVIAVSDATRRDYLSRFHVPAERIRNIPLAVDPVFRPQTADRLALVRARYGLPERYVLYLGSNKPHKNLVRLVEAWGMLQPQSSQLVVAGPWDPRYPAPHLRAEAVGLGDSIRWLGPVAEPDLPALYSGALLFAFPSLYEGFGLPVLEAMACGAAVVCSNSSSLPEVASDAALLADPLDTRQLAAAMAQALSDESLRQQMREKGLARAQLFTWEQTARQTLDIYRN